MILLIIIKAFCNDELLLITRGFFEWKSFVYIYIKLFLFAQVFRERSFTFKVSLKIIYLQIEWEWLFHQETLEHIKLIKY